MVRIGKIAAPTMDPNDTYLVIETIIMNAPRANNASFQSM